MAKQITKTTVKLSITHDRLALTAKFVDGTYLKMSLSRFAERMSSTASCDDAVKKIFAAVSKRKTGETPGQRFERFAKFFESTTSVVDASEKIAFA